MTPFVFYGTFMRGQAGHPNLAGATFVERVRTAPRYRLFFVDERWPALVPVDREGVEIDAELYEASEELLERLAQIEPPGWERGPVELSDGRRTEAFLGVGELATRGRDISEHGGWARYVG